MPKKTTTLFAGAQVAAALKQGGEADTDGQKMVEKSVAKGGGGCGWHRPLPAHFQDDGGPSWYRIFFERECLLPWAYNFVQGRMKVVAVPHFLHT